MATNDVRFLTPNDFEAHEARVCIHDGRVLNDARRPRRYTANQYLRSPQEMIELFTDLPEAIENSVEIAKRCTLELELGKSYLPAFPVPERRSEDEWFEREARAGLEQRLKSGITLSPADLENGAARYHQRLGTEMEVINSKGFAGYFLIVADFVNWAKRNGVPVGPGRGSGAGSLVAYSLGITELDPIHYDLLFERFLNPERFRYRILTSTSAWKVAIGSSTTLPSDTAVTSLSHKSSRLAPWPQRRSCAMSDGCLVTLTVSSI